MRIPFNVSSIVLCCFCVVLIFSCSKDAQIFDEIISEEVDENGNTDPDDNVDPDVVVDNTTSGDLKAFPTAEGAGALTKGGRGGKILHVTRLDDARDANGDPVEGTFRWALFQPFARIVVFDVSGTIRLTEGLNLRYEKHSFLTIAGQTAPEGGITIETPEFNIVKMEHVIVRYIRVVNNGYFLEGGPFNRPAANFSGIRNLIVDHCSFRYSWNSVALAVTDENYPQGQNNITVQKSIFADCKTGILVGAAVTPTRIDNAGKNTIHHNLFNNISHRFPNVSGNGQFDIINNVAYNYYWRLSSYYNNSETNLINNYYKAGPSSLGIITSAGDGPVMKIGDNVTNMPNNPKIYSAGNVIEDPGNALTASDNRWSRFFALFSNGTIDAEEAKYRSQTKFEDLGVAVQTQSAYDGMLTVLADVGANAFLNENGTSGSFLDSVDEKYISDVQNDDCTSCKANNSYPNLGDKTQLRYPVLPENVRATNFDTDRDGMPDSWEIAMGLDPNVADDKNDKDGDGYTNIEEYLNLVDLN